MCGIHGESLSYISQTKEEMRKQRWQCLEAIQWERNTHIHKKVVILLPLILPDTSKMIYFLIKEIQALAVLTYISFPILVRLL